MKILFGLLAVSLFVGCSTTAPRVNTSGATATINQPDYNARYQFGPDSMPKAGVPRGEVIKMPPFTNSTVFPGTVRDWWIYVPKQYDANKPA